MSDFLLSLQPKPSLKALYANVKRADWYRSNLPIRCQVEPRYERTASFVEKSNRVIFNIKGNAYRVFVAVARI